MNNNQNKYNKEEIPVYRLIKKIKTGELEAKNLTKEQRQACVEVLTLEGYQVSTIAELLDRSEKTIKRDLDDIWLKNSSGPTQKFVLRMIAEMISKGRSQQAHLVRIARDKDTSPKDKVEAEKNAWRIGEEMARLLQVLGYLPSQSGKITGDFSLETEDEETSLLELKEKLNQLTQIAKDENLLSEDVKKKIEGLKEEIKRAEIAQKVDDLSNEIEKRKEDENET